MQAHYIAIASCWPTVLWLSLIIIINMHEGDIVKMVDIYTCRQAVRGARSTTEMYPATYITLIMINLINHKCKQ